MAISAYTGLPGSGKSYEVVNGPIWKALGRDRLVWTNIPVTLPGVHVVTGADAADHWYLKAPAGALVVIDECWRYWASGVKADGIPETIKEWFAMHRHRTDGELATDVILVTQDLSQIAAFVRGLVEKTYRMRKLVELGSRNTYRVDVYNGAVTGQRPPQAQHMNGWITKYKPEGFARYKSHTQGGEAKEVNADKRGSMLRRPAVLALPFALVGLLFLPWLGGVIFGGGKDEAQAAQPRGAAAPVKPAEPTPPAAEPSKPVEVARPQPQPLPAVETSTRWTLLGVVVKADGEGIALLQTTTGRRRVSVKDHCQRGEGGDWTCKVDGETVAMWTGSSMGFMAQGSTYTRQESQ